MHLGKAISWFFKVLKEGDDAIAQRPQLTEEKPAFAGSSEEGVQLLALFQKEGRLIDFLMEDVSGFDDAEIGAAVRDIHKGCRKVLDEHFTLRRVLTEAEGDSVTVPEGFDPSTIDLQGNVSGSAPFKGTLVHGGWYADEVKLPTVPAGADAKVVAPAQVEVG